MKKKLLSLMMAGALMLTTMAGCGLQGGDSQTKEPSSTGGDVSANADSPAANDPVVTFVMAEVNPLDTIVGRMDSKFKEEVERLSGGTVKIDLQAAGVLGSENDVLDTMLGGGGTIDISRISAFALTSYGGEKSMLLSIPYTFKNREHFWAFVDSDMAEEFLLEPSEKGSGVRGLFYGEEGFRHFFTKNAISGMSDLSGMKLRVSNDPIMNGMVEGLGGSPTVVAFGELYSALQTGVVDGAEQPIANYKSNAFPEVAPYMILDGHTLGAVQVVITDDAWNKMTENQQKAMKEAGEIASQYCRQISEEAENEVLEELKKDGVTIIDVPDNSEWADACKKVIEENTSSQADLYQKILDLAK